MDQQEITRRDTPENWHAETANHYLRHHWRSAGNRWHIRPHPTTPGCWISVVATLSRCLACTWARYPDPLDVMDKWRNGRNAFLPFDLNAGCYLEAA
jgi:hypothetical protein